MLPEHAIAFPPDLALRNDRVELRPLQWEDFEALLSFGLREPELWTYGLESPTSAMAMRTYVERALAQRDQGQSLPFVVQDVQTNQVVGCTRYYQIQRDHLRVAIGYTWIGKEFQGTGLNGAMKSLMLNYVFDTCQWRRVEFMADVQNTKSIAAILKLGAKQEGVLRSHAIKPNGERRDTAVFSILSSEWKMSFNA